MSISIFSLALTLIQAPTSTLVITTDDIARSTDRVLTTIADSQYKNAIVSIMLQGEKSDPNGTPKITLNPSCKLIVNALHAAGKDFDFVLSLTKIEAWMQPLVDLQMIEYSTVGAYARTKVQRYLNLVGARFISDRAKKCLDELDGKPKGIYFDCRYPPAPIYYASDFSRQNSIFGIGIDPVDVQDIDIANIEESLAMMPEEKKQMYLSYNNFRNIEVRKGMEAITGSWRAIGPIGYCVSEAHFMVSPLIQSIESSDFLQKDSASIFSHILIVPSQSKVNRMEFLKALDSFDQRAKSQVHYCWVQSKIELGADRILLSKHSSLKSKFRFGINLN